MYDEDFEDEDEDAQSNETTEVDINKTEIAIDLRKKLSQFFGYEEEKLDNIVAAITNNTLNSFRSHVTELIQGNLSKYIALKADRYIEKIFTEELEKQDIFANNQVNSSVIVASTKAVILNRVNEFFRNSWDSEKKRDRIIGKSLDEIIARTVDAKVSEAIEEIKTEAIEKFNKEAMKKMMSAMAKTIGQDKRLLTILTDEY